MDFATRWALCACMVLLLTAPLAAAPPGIQPGSAVPPLPMAGAGPVQPNGYGITDEQVMTVSAFEFVPWDSSDSFTADSWAYRWLESVGPFIASVKFPSGAVATSIEIEGCDTNDAADLSVDFFRLAGTPQPLGALMTSGSAGCGFWSGPLNSPTTMSAADSYILQVFQGVTFDGTLKFRAIRIYYTLQVSPAPATATFADVPVGSALHQYVEALAAAGITGGCGGGNFCPNAAVTRGQIAVFLAKALGLHWAP